MVQWLIISLLAGAWAVTAQQEPAPSSSITKTDVVTYRFDWPQGVPWQKYTVTVQANGQCHFQGSPHPDDINADPDTVQQDFTISAANLQKIFDLTQKLNYFQGDVDSHLKHIAQTGRKTLQYESPQLHGSTTFNWSQNADAQALVNLFSAIAMTIDYGQKLAFQYRFDKLGMDQRLKELEELQNSRGVAELSLIAPILQKIAADPNLMNMDRQVARHLLASIHQPDPSSETFGQH